MNWQNIAGELLTHPSVACQCLTIEAHSILWYWYRVKQQAPLLREFASIELRQKQVTNKIYSKEYPSTLYEKVSVRGNIFTVKPV